MANVLESITIARPVAVVFAFAGDYRNDPQWRSGIAEMSVMPDGEIKVGSVTREILRFAGKVYTTEAHVTTWEPNQKTAFRSFAGANRVEGERLFDSDASGTRLTYQLKITAKSMMDSLMMPLLAVVFRRQVRNDLKKLKALIEQG